MTPAKAALTPGTSGINTVDVVAIQRHFLLVGTPLSGCQLVAAEVDLNGLVNTVDVVAVQRFFLLLQPGIEYGKIQVQPAESVIRRAGQRSKQSELQYDCLW